MSKLSLFVRVMTTMAQMSQMTHLGFSVYGVFSLRLIGSAMFGVIFNLVTSVGLPQFLEH